MASENVSSDVPAVRTEHDSQRRPNDPSPEQIRERCLEIQRGWTETERRQREQGAIGRDQMRPREPYSVPQCKVRIDGRSL